MVLANAEDMLTLCSAQVFVTSKVQDEALTRG